MSCPASIASRVRRVEFDRRFGRFEMGPGPRTMMWRIVT